jgi:hypothetical protein
MLAVGRPSAIPVALLVANLIAVGIIGSLGVLLARDAGIDGRWGLLLPFFPGFLLSISRDLAEVWACAFVLASIVLLHRRRFAALAVTLTLAVLTRETTVLFAASVALVALWPAGDRPRRAALLVFPFVVLGAWQLFLRLKWGEFPFLNGPDLGLPGRGYLALFQGLIGTISLLELLWMVLALAVLALGLLALLHLRHSGADASTKLAWAGYAGLAALLPSGVWVEDWAFMRATSELCALGLIIVLASEEAGPRTRRALGASIALFWTLEVVARISHP